MQKDIAKSAKGMKCNCGELYEIVTRNYEFIAICPKCGNEEESQYIAGYMRRNPNRHEKNSQSSSVRRS